MARTGRTELRQPCLPNALPAPFPGKNDFTHGLKAFGHASGPCKLRGISGTLGVLSAMLGTPGTSVNISPGFTGAGYTPNEESDLMTRFLSSGRNATGVVGAIELPAQFLEPVRVPRHELPATCHQPPSHPAAQPANQPATRPLSHLSRPAGQPPSEAKQPTALPNN